MLAPAYSQDAIDLRRCQQLEDQKVCHKIELSPEVEEALASDLPIERKWQIIFSFGPFVTYHGPVNLRLKNENTDVTIENIQPMQRTSFGHYKFYDPSETKPLQFLDEPQNKFTIEATDGKFFVGLEYIHPKVIYHNGKYPQTVNIHGVIDGVEVSEQNADLSDYFGQITSTYGNANIDLFAGRVINITGKNSKRGQLSLHLGAGVGISFSSGQVDPIQNGQVVTHEKPPIKVNGTSLSTRTKLRYSFPNDRVHLTLGHDYSLGHINGQFGDYHSKASLRSHRFHFGVGISIGNGKKKRKKKKH
jgi:hypothetical protein